LRSCPSRNGGPYMKKYLFTGMIILFPVAITLMLIVYLFDLFTTPFVPVESLLISVESALLISIPDALNIFFARLITLLLLFVFILFLGWIARWLFVRNLIKGTHSILIKIPFIKTVFKVSRDIFSAIFSHEGNKAFKRPVMIPFPDYPNHTIGFEVGDAPAECQKKVAHPLGAIFMPTAPHPLSGLLLFINRNEIHTLEMSNEDAFKMLVSCGMIVPKKHE
jgi:uncharacterized membrane protein